MASAMNLIQPFIGAGCGRMENRMRWLAKSLSQEFYLGNWFQSRFQLPVEADR